jgi:hypothetical protein
MPLVTLTWRKGKSAEFQTAVLDAVHRALAAASGVPEKDRFHRVLSSARRIFDSTRPIPT